MKILWVGDAVAATGFATVTHEVCRVLSQVHDHVVVILGVNYNGDPHDLPWRVYPAGAGDVGAGRIAEVYAREKPDVVMLLGDPWVLPFYLQALPADAKTVAYVPVDAANQWAGRKLNTLRALVSYTKFGACELRKGGYLGPLHIVPHGINLASFYPETNARTRFGLDKAGLHDKFIVGNINRNQLRKRLDLSIIAFGQWVSEYRIFDAILLLHCAVVDVGWELMQLAGYFGIEDKLLLTGSKSMTNMSPIARLRTVYNLQDVQISTTMGEGWGLTTMEGMACGVPQIVPDYSALGEWTEGAADLIPCSNRFVHTNGVNTVGGVVDTEYLTGAIDIHYQIGRRNDVPDVRSLGLVSQPQYTWASVGQRFHEILTEVACGH